MPCVDVGLLGMGAAKHPSRNQSTIAVGYMGYNVLVDAGCQAAQRLYWWAGGEVDEVTVLLTHGHYDHLCGLPMIAFLLSFRSGSLSIYGEQSAVEAARRAVSAAIALAGNLRVEYREIKPGDRLTIGSLIIEAFEASHSVPALSYSVDAGGVKIVVSGDTRPTEEFKRRAIGAALAVHEATFPSGMEKRAYETGHSTVSQALSQVEGADVAVLYHLSPESEAEVSKAASRTSQGRLAFGEEPIKLKIC